MKLAEVAPQPGQPEEDVWVPSACGMCYSQCGIKVHRVNGVVVKIEGNPDFPHNWGRLCAKGHAAIMSLYDPSRVRTPLKRTNPEKGIGVDPKWVEIGWEEAIDLVADKLERQVRDAEDKRRSSRRRRALNNGGELIAHNAEDIFTEDEEGVLKELGALDAVLEA